MNHRRGSFKDWMALVVAGCMALAAVCCGRTFCFCSEDPDGCGEHCHVCEEHVPDGVSAADPCVHLSFGFLDFWDEDGSVTVAGAGTFPVASAWWPVAAQHQFSLTSRPASRSHAPPGTYSDSVLSRLRRILLLS